MICNWHLCNNILSGRQKKFCSTKCNNKFYVDKNRRESKKRLVAEFGGKCILCGYNKSIAGLHFHHKENNKEFGLGNAGSTMSYERRLEEAKKCILICANCHAEIHEKEKTIVER